MRKLVVSEFMTLDGIMQAPGTTDEDPSGGFRHGGWQGAYYDDAFGQFVLDGMAAADAFLFGRRTYETFAAFWPTQPPDHPVAAPMNATQKYVVSTSLTDPLPWQNSTVIGDDVATTIRQLKAEDGKDIVVIGSGELVQTLIRENLIDEYRLMVHPLVLGTGKRLFRDESTLSRLELLDSSTTSKGVLLLRYRPAT
jgi:dihydrofolate reductase